MTQVLEQVKPGVAIRPHAGTHDTRVCVHRGKLSVCIRSDLVDQLLGPGGFPIEQWLDSGAAGIVKSGRHRTVYRIATSSGIFYLKHFRSTGWRDVLQATLRGSRARREARAIEQIAALGIPTIETVALAERRSGPFVTESFLVTRAIENTQTVQDWCEKQVAAGISLTRAHRTELASRLAGIIARMHAGGILHRDLHAGNFLLRPEPGGRFRLWLIDLHSIRRQRRLKQRQIVRELAMFQHFFTQHATPTDRLRFVDTYLQELHGLKAEMIGSAGGSERRSFLRALIAESRSWTYRAFRKADEKWHRGHRKLTIATTHTTHVRAVAELGTTFAQRALANSDEAANGVPGVERVWTSPDSSARRMLERTWLGKSRRWGIARTIWEIGHALDRRGIAVEKPLLFVEQTIDGQSRERIICAFAGDAESGTGNPRTQRRLLQQAGRLFRRLHEHDFLQQRPSPAMFSRGCDPGGDLRVYLTRIESVIPATHVLRDDAVAQLAELSSRSTVTRTDRLRFLRAYLGWNECSEWKSWWRDIAELPVTEVARTPLGAHRRQFLRAALLTAAFALGCRSTKQQVLTRPARHSIRSGQLLVLSDFKLESNHPAIADLILLRKQVTVMLDLPAQREDVVVYIFNSRDEYRAYLNSVYPGLPDRRAYFVGTAQELAVYTYWGKRIQEDLRHEYTHGLLHASLMAVPLWLDEGLAEYFEVGGSRPGTVNSDYATRLASSLKTGWKPNMQRLEQVEEFSQLQHIDYQEAWAWVHFLLHHSPETKQVLLSYLNDLRTKRRPEALSVRLRRDLPTFDERFAIHINSLQMPQMLFGNSSRPSSVVPAGGQPNSPGPWK